MQSQTTSLCRGEKGGNSNLILTLDFSIKKKIIRNQLKLIKNELKVIKNRLRVIKNRLKVIRNKFKN